MLQQQVKDKLQIKSIPKELSLLLLKLFFTHSVREYTFRTLLNINLGENEENEVLHMARVL